MDGADLQDLYQQLILDHSRQPRNFRAIDDATQVREGYNPLCGDQIKVYLKSNNGLIEDIAFEGKGCAICTASSSIMTQQLKGIEESEALALFHRFHQVVTGAEIDFELEDIGKAAVFSGIRKYPMRVKCAILPWHTAKAAIENSEQTVTTE